MYDDDVIGQLTRSASEYYTTTCKRELARISEANDDNDSLDGKTVKFLVYETFVGCLYSQGIVDVETVSVKQTFFRLLARIDVNDFLRDAAIVKRSSEIVIDVDRAKISADIALPVLDFIDMVAKSHSPGVDDTRASKSGAGVL